jgi:predicted nucleic acid-binding protein
MIFVDTTVWYAAYVAEDPEHGAAKALLDVPQQRLATTDYIIDELLTLLKARGQYGVAQLVGRLMFSGRLCHIEWLDHSDVEAAWRIFDGFVDKDWSFTDCVSYVVMQRLGISEAWALDEHFCQFGFATVRP